MIRFAVMLSFFGCAWLLAPARADEAEDTAVKLVAKLGGNVIRDEKAKDKPVVEVLLGARGVTDAALKGMRGFKNVQRLHLGHTKLSDAGLKELAELKQLQSLDLSDTKVGDAGLKELTGLKQLHTLDLRRTRVTDAGLKVLAQLPQLQTLNLSQTDVTDEAIAGFRRALPNCEVVR